jgi:hypothetical protein
MSKETTSYLYQIPKNKYILSLKLRTTITYLRYIICRQAYNNKHFDKKSSGKPIKYKLSRKSVIEAQREPTN